MGSRLFSRKKIRQSSRVSPSMADNDSVMTITFDITCKHQTRYDFNEVVLYF